MATVRCENCNCRIGAWSFRKTAYIFNDADGYGRHFCSRECCGPWRNEQLKNGATVSTARDREAVNATRHKDGWSAYTVSLLGRLQASMRRHSDVRKLRFLLYPSRLLPEDEARIRTDDAGVVWLGKD